LRENLAGKLVLVFGAETENNFIVFQLTVTRVPPDYFNQTPYFMAPDPE
jgi:hypothetical protein